MCCKEFVGLGSQVTGCQTEEDRVDCLTRIYRQTVLDSCTCQPYYWGSDFGNEVTDCETRL